jgi:hypothetical protein
MGSVIGTLCGRYSRFKGARTSSARSSGGFRPSDEKTNPINNIGTYSNPNETSTHGNKTDSDGDEEAPATGGKELLSEINLSNEVVKSRQSFFVTGDTVVEIVPGGEGKRKGKVAKESIHSSAGIQIKLLPHKHSLFCERKVQCCTVRQRVDNQASQPFDEVDDL